MFSERLLSERLLSESLIVCCNREPALLGLKEVIFVPNTMDCVLIMAEFCTKYDGLQGSKLDAALSSLRLVRCLTAFFACLPTDLDLFWVCFDAEPRRG